MFKLFLGCILAVTEQLTDEKSCLQIVVNSSLDVLSVNKRVVVRLTGALCGECLMVIVGAAAVGSIHMTRKRGDRIRKGEELGYFAYGGSTVVTLFQRGRVELDGDLRARSRQGTETLVRTGASLGRSIRGPAAARAA